MITQLNNDNMELKKLFNSTFSSIYSYDIDDDFANNKFTKYFIYMDNCNIIGFVNYYDLYDRYEIANIFVLNEYRRKGIGSSLIEEVINTGNNNHIINITLEVRIDNYNAISLYEKYDFKKVAIREKYYKGIDGILMERKMK
jgi:ribosomal-protein-alanine N-acetyltransferase